MVVDDIAEQREVVSGLLDWLGYEVHAVSGGEAAVEYLKGNKADILVLDMIMRPGIDGLETYQRILEINPEQKAIIVSGFSDINRIREALKTGGRRLRQKTLPDGGDRRGHSGCVKPLERDVLMMFSNHSCLSILRQDTSVLRYPVFQYCLANNPYTTIVEMIRTGSFECRMKWHLPGHDRLGSNGFGK